MPVFTTIGCLIAWTFLKYGKRKILIGQSILAIIAISISMVRQYEAFLFGRILIGFVFGVSNTISPMFIKDINPEKNRGPLIALIQLVLNFGFIASLLLAFLLPQFTRPRDGVEDYWGPLENTYIAWREMLGFPIIIATTQLLAFILIFKKEDPLYEEYILFKNVSFQPDFSLNSEDTSNRNKFNYNIQQVNLTPVSRLEKDTWKRLWREAELK